MICPMVPFPMTLSDPLPRFHGHGVIRLINVFDVLCAQLMRDLFAIAKFLFFFTYDCRMKLNTKFRSVTG